MTYPELKIALDIGDPVAILSSIGIKPVFRTMYYVVCDDGNCHLFDRDGKEHKIDYIPSRCFASSTLKTIIIPKTVESIEEYAFSWCGALVKATIPDSIAKIANGTFHRCFSLKNVSLGSNVKEICSWAFDWCVDLEELLIPDLLERIGEGAFYQCSKLRSLTLPSSIKHIGEDAFRRCPKLERVLFKGKTIEQVKAMDYYPWGIEDVHIIQAEL